MSLSDTSELSSPPSSNEEGYIDSPPKKGIAKFFLKPKAKKAAAADTEDDESPPRKKRSPSPPHECGLADNPDIAFIVMFRSRFHEVFPASLSSFGPQDLERGAIEPVPGQQIESLLCALIGLVLNRKKLVERGHHQRALEEAVHTHASQWPKNWAGQNPLRGGRTFANMDASERLHLIRTLTLWTLSSSEAVQAMIKESYKQARRDDDLNQPLSVQPWGQDGDRRRYWLVEGRDDTEFRLYRESDPKAKQHDWRAVAGTIEELRPVIDRLNGDGSQAARRLSERITLAIPRFEATVQKRKQREYRLARKAQFAKPEPGFSLYEGRTRGKKLKYTFSEEEDEEQDSDARPATRRTNGRSDKSTPSAEGAEGPVFTASGRQVKSRIGGVYGESMLSGRGTGNTVVFANTAAAAAVAGGESEKSGEGQQESPSGGRPRRTGLRQPSSGKGSGGREHIAGYNEVDEMDDEEDAQSSGADEYVGEDGANEAGEDVMSDDDDPADMDQDGDDAVLKHNQRLLVQLRYHQKPAEKATETTRAGHAGGGVSTAAQAAAATDPDEGPASSVSKNHDTVQPQPPLMDRPSASNGALDTTKPVSLGTEVSNALS
ncbi:MAG: hypothetical protein M1816_003241 [Peltula sp. TS41687]|nr:MAG: hypothetical protein M1816_003241 [Peltula sp. TS41687]